MLENKEVKLISIEDIVPNRFQPRLAFGEEELNELADSIKEHGIIQPLILRQLGDKYEIIAGERRYKAASIAGLNNVPAVIVDKDDNESAEIAIIENIQRKDLTAIEEAKSYKKLLNKGLTQEEVAKKLGIAQSTVANKLRLLTLSSEVQEALLKNRISERHARSLLKLDSSVDQVDLLNRIINEKLTVKQTDEEIDKLQGKMPMNHEENEIPIFEEFEEEPKIIENIQPEEPKVENPEVLSPFDSEEKEPEEQVEEEPEVSIQPVNNTASYEEPEEIFTIDEEEPKNTDVFNNYGYLDAVNKLRDTAREIDAKGTKISTEEYDLDNEYQIIIKIEK